jgi:hypothetical protein
MNNSYRCISDFGSKAVSAVNDPLTYCINNQMDQRFLHGSSSDTLGQHSKSCQLYLSEYCAQKWDGFCELASKNQNYSYPNNLQECNSASDVACMGLTAGEVLIRNTASEKYLVNMRNCKKKYEPFDPTVASSPMISYWVKDSNCANNGNCVPEYQVDPKTIDDDIVMDKILQKPIIAIKILINIYNTMKRKGTLKHLRGTKLGKYYSNNPYFKSKGNI